MNRISLASLLTAALVATTATPVRAQAAAEEVRATVAVDTSDVGDAGPIIQRRAEERADVVLRAAEVLPGDSPDDPVIQIVVHEVTGDDPGFAFDLTIERSGEIAQRRRIECNLCTETEIVAKIESEVTAVIDELAREASEAPRADPDPVASDPVDDAEGASGTTTDDARRLGPRGKAGVALLVTGGVATAVGIGLAIPGWKPVDGEPTQETSPRPIGLATLGVGAAVAITGGILLGLDRRARTHRRARLDVATGRNLTLVTLRGRF